MTTRIEAKRLSGIDLGKRISSPGDDEHLEINEIEHTRKFTVIRYSGPDGEEWSAIYRADALVTITGITP